MPRRSPDEPYPSRTTVVSPTVDQRHQRHLEQKFKRGGKLRSDPPTTLNDYRD